MAFLQVKKNLADINNICEAQNNLGLLSMAYQCKCNVDIYNGKISISNLTLRGSNIDSNYILVSKNRNGDVMWKRQALQEWMEKSPSEIYLSSFCNDQNYIKETEINYTISNYIEEFRDTIINNNLDIDSITISNITVTDNFHFVSSNNNFPCVLTNNGFGSNLFMTKIEQSISNNNNNTVCSASAVSNLYGIVKEIESQLPDEGSAYMISTNNLDDVGFNKVYAVSNLGLNDSFYTKDLTLSNVYFSDSTLEENGNTFYLIRNNNTLSYKRLQYIQSYLETSDVNPPSATSVNNLYEFLNEGVNNRLITSNVLSEIISADANGCNNPYLPIFQNRLGEAGIQTVAFTANWYDLINAPRKLSGFSNVDFNNDTLFIYSKCNLSDLENPTQAMINLGVSKVGRTGNFADLELPVAISNIVSADSLLGAIPGVPFLIKTSNLSELQNVAEARHNLGIGDMATFNRNNVEILNGNITSCNLVINSNMRYLHSNTDITLSGQNGNNVFLKCFTADGLAKWEDLPVAETVLSTQGIVYLTNDLDNSSSNVAITAFALSNVFFNNSNITDLVPLADLNNFGIVKTTSNYESPTLNHHTVVNSYGISNMYNTLQTGLDTINDYINGNITDIINSKMSNITISNYNSTNFLQILDLSEGDNIIKEISLNFDNTPNNYLASDGTFKEIKNISVSNLRSENEFLKLDDVNGANGTTVKQLTLHFPNNTNEYLCGDGIFKEIRNISVSNLKQANEFLELNVVSGANGTLVNQLTLKYPNDPNEYLCGDGTFKEIKNISVSNFKPVNDFLRINEVSGPGDTTLKQITLHYPDIANQYLSGDGTFKVVQPTRLVKDALTIEHDIYLGAGLNIVNTGVANDLVLDGFLIGGSTNHSKNIRSTIHDTYLHYNNTTNEYSFQLLNQDEFTLLTPGFVPAPNQFNTDDKVLLSGGWSKITDFQSNNLDIFNGDNKGLVTKLHLDSVDKTDYYLNAKGNWKHKSLITDVSGTVIDIDTTNAVEVFDVVKDITSAGMNVTLNFKNGSNYQVITKSDDSGSYVWKDVIDVILNGGVKIPIENGNNVDDGNMYLTAEGNFDTPPSAKNFTVYMTIDRATNTLQLVQKINEPNLPTGDTECNVVLNYTHKYEDIIYETGGNYRIHNYGESVYDNIINYNGLSFNQINTSLIHHNQDRIFTVSGLSNYINKFKNDFIETNYNGAINDYQIFTTKATSNYIKAQFDDYRHNNDDDFTGNIKYTTPHTVIDYIDSRKFGNDAVLIDVGIRSYATFSDDLNFTTPMATSNYINLQFNRYRHTDINDFSGDVSFVTPKATSNYIKAQFDVYRHDNVNFTGNVNFTTPDKVIDYIDSRKYDSLQSLNFNNNDINFTTPKATFNYIQNQFDSFRHTEVVFSGDIKYTTPDKVVEYIESRKYDSEESTNFTNNVDFTTPAAVKKFGDGNYVQLTTIQDSHTNNGALDTFLHNSFVPTAHTIYQYVNWYFDRSSSVTTAVNTKFGEVRFDSSKTNYENEDNDFITPKAVVAYLNNFRKFDKLDFNYNSANLQNNDEDFITPAAVSNYVDDLYIPKTKILTSSQGYDGYFVDDDTIPTTAETSNIAKAILDMNIGATPLGENSRMEELEFRFDTRGMLVMEKGLLGVLDNSYKKRNTKTGNIYGYAPTYEDIKDNFIPTCGLTSNMINDRIFELVKNNRRTPGEDIYEYIITTNDDFENKYIPTVGFMNREIIATVNSTLEDGEIELNLDSLNIGGGLNTSNITVANLKIEQDIQFLYGDRIDLIANEQFMTLDDQGFVQFLKVNTVAGLNNTVRADDENSLITGLHNTTFGDNQLVCGQYNTNDNIYVRNTCLTGQNNTVNLAVGTGSDAANRKNGLEVHNTGEVYVNNNLILGDKWRISFNSDQLVIEKLNDDTKLYEQKHIFK